VVALRLRSTTDYRLPTFGPHGTKLGAFLISMKNENLINGLLDNSEKEDVSGHCERLQGISCGFSPPQEHCRLPPT